MRLELVGWYEASQPISSEEVSVAMKGLRAGHDGEESPGTAP